MPKYKSHRFTEKHIPHPSTQSGNRPSAKSIYDPSVARRMVQSLEKRHG